MKSLSKISYGHAINPEDEEGNLTPVDELTLDPEKAPFEIANKIALTKTRLEIMRKLEIDQKIIEENAKDAVLRLGEVFSNYKGVLEEKIMEEPLLSPFLPEE